MPTCDVDCTAREVLLYRERRGGSICMPYIDSVLLQANFRNRGSAADPSHVIPSIQRLRVLESSSTKRKSTRLCANSSYPSALRKQLVFLIRYGMSIVAFTCSQGTVDIDVFYYRSFCFFPLCHTPHAHSFVQAVHTAAYHFRCKQTHFTSIALQQGVWE